MKNKIVRIISLIIVLIFTEVCLMGASCGGGGNKKVDASFNIEARQEDNNVEVIVSIKNGSSQIKNMAGYQFNLQYDDSKLRFQDITSLYGSEVVYGNNSKYISIVGHNDSNTQDINANATRELVKIIFTKQSTGKATFSIVDSDRIDSGIAILENGQFQMFAALNKGSQSLSFQIR